MAADFSPFKQMGLMFENGSKCNVIPTTNNQPAASSFNRERRKG